MRMKKNCGIPKKYFELYPCQVVAVNKGLEIFKKYGMVYLNMGERTGKTLTALIIAYKFKPDARVLVYTKKGALNGWKEWIQNDYFKGKNITLNNYENKTIYNDGDFDIVILDESHNYLSKFPRPSVTYKKVFNIAKNAHVIYCSATPCSEGYSKIFHQLNLCKYSPFSYLNYKNFYQWFKIFGVNTYLYIGGVYRIQYNRTKFALIRNTIAPYFVNIRRDFKQEPKDELIQVEYTKEQKDLIKMVLSGGFIDYKGKTKTCDSKLAEVLAILQIESGVLKCDDGSFLNIKTRKTEYIDKNSAVFVYFKEEEQKLIKKGFNVYHYLRHAEGVDLSMYKSAYIHTPNYSATKYSQVRSRLSNHKREEEIRIFWLNNGKNSICYNIYKSVVDKNKKFSLGNFVRSNDYHEMVDNLLKM